MMGQQKADVHTNNANEPNPYGFLVSVLSFIPGAWLVIALCILGYTSLQAIRNDVIVGIIVVALTAWSLVVVRRAHVQQSHAHAV
ncbi:MAG: hypothetical protein ABI068_12310 [Ktedonobacterales bacterium]